MKKCYGHFRGGLLLGLAVAIAVAAAAITYERYDTKTLKRTIRRGDVLCGVNKGLPGFSIHDDKGDWTGFDVDFCRAIAAAIFDDPPRSQIRAARRQRTLQGAAEPQGRRAVAQHDLDHVAREQLRLYFPAVAYYDGQGFMLPRSRNIDSALDLNDSKVCVQEGRRRELNLADYFRANNMKYTEVKFPRAGRGAQGL